MKLAGKEENTIKKLREKEGNKQLHTTFPSQKLKKEKYRMKKIKPLPNAPLIIQLAGS